MSMNILDIKREEIANNMAKLEEIIHSDNTSSQKKIEAIKKFKQLQIEFARVSEQAIKEPMFQDLKVREEAEKTRELTNIELNSQEKLMVARRNIVTQKEATLKYNQLLKKVEKEAISAKRAKAKAEREIAERESILFGDNPNGIENGFIELRYKKLGKKLTLGAIASTTATGLAYALAPQFFVPLGIVSGAMAILKSGHVASKIVSDSGGVQVVARDTANLLPKASGMIGGLVKDPKKAIGNYATQQLQEQQIPMEMMGGMGDFDMPERRVG